MAYLYPEGFPNDDWTQVELFRLAHGRLPNAPGDSITQKTLDRFCDLYDRQEIKSDTTDLLMLRLCIAKGKVKLTHG